MRNFDRLIDDMSLEEKLAEITQLYGSAYTDDTSTFMGIDYRFETDLKLADNIGSVLGVAGAAMLKKAQKQHMEKSRHHIPLIFMHDIIHGFKTIFPSPLAMSCSWQPDLVKESAQIAAKEASVSGIHVTFSPMCDLARDARWGRVVETSGEDPYLNALYARAYVEGYQGKNIKDRYKLASCFKHFAAYSMAEAGRDYNTTDVSEYELRENHFPAYKAAVDAGAKMAMTSFNALNGVPSSGNKWLFQGILRDEWDFKGTVISDCTAIIELINHGFAENESEAANKALDAGVDMEMVSNTYYNNAAQLIREGKLSEERINQAVRRVLELKESLGLFENPYKDADENEEKEIVLCQEHRKIARKTAANSMVLLKNDGILPLKKNGVRVGLIGPLANSRQMLDTWSAYGEEKDCRTLKEVLEERLGSDLEFVDYSNLKEEHEQLNTCDVIILAIGEEPMMSGESNSRMDIGLPDNQEELAEEIFELGKPVVAVLYNGRPLAVPEIQKKAVAVLEAWLPGTEGNPAVGDLLFADELPSGRLTMSFPYAVGQCPIYYNRYSTGRPSKDVFHSERFSSRYVDGPSVPLYPFGYGLTYTEFVYGDVELSTPVMKRSCSLTASCVLTNVGKWTGTETVQLYIRDIAASRVRPIRQLKGFKRLTLEPAESVAVSFEIEETMLAFHHSDGQFTAEPGKFQVWIAPDAASGKCAEFELEA